MSSACADHGAPSDRNPASLRTAWHLLPECRPSRVAGRAFSVGVRRGNGQFHLGSCTEPAPHGELAAGELRTLAHAVQAEVASAALGAQHGRVDAYPVVAHAQAHLPLVVANLDLDLSGARVPDR